MKFLFGAMLSTSILFGFTDFGIDGNLWDIKEENLLKTIDDTVKEYRFDKKKIDKKIMEEVKKQSIGTTDLPYVKEVSAIEVDNYQIISQDIVNPAGRIWRRKGDKVLMNTKVPLDLCFVDGKNLEVLKNQISYMDKVVAKKSKTECTYMVSDRSVLELNKIYYPRVFYPTRKAYEDRFMVKSIPTYIRIENSKKTIYSFPISMFKHEVKINEK